ncbi:MAG: protein translocase subunit SecF [Ignavibacteriae bacterium]|nr:protein translocase subunit SecF [Ignavibacteriota bacterium]
MRFFKETHIDFMGKRRTWYMVSLAVIMVGMISLAIKGIGFGIDFLGGTELIVQFTSEPDVSQIRTMMDNAGYRNVEIKTYGDPLRILIRTESQGEGTTVADQIKATLQQTFPNMNPTVLEETKIGPKIGAELRKDAFYAIFFSLIAIMVYVGFRFKFIYGIGAVTALFHDVLVTLGVISIIDGVTPFTNFEIDQNMIAALLTLVGLSVNDTVVIFDRIRENQKIYKTLSLMEVMNKSLNQTLSRTLITSGTIFIVTVILFLFGGEVNRGFGFALTFGIITGTYSSIYVASAVVLDYSNWRLAKKAKPVMKGKTVYEPIAQ